MKLYSLNGEMPAPIPEKIVLADGTVRTCFETYSDSEIASAGYVLVDNPPVPVYPNRLSWTGTQWQIREPNQTEIAEQVKLVRAKRNQLLIDSDVHVIRAYESGAPVSTQIKEYRQALRDITLQSDPFNIVWPQLPQ